VAGWYGKDYSTKNELEALRKSGTRGVANINKSEVVI